MAVDNGSTDNVYHFDNHAITGENQEVTGQPYELALRTRRHSQRFNSEQLSYEARIRPELIPDHLQGSVLNTAVTFLRGLIHQLITDVTSTLGSNDLVRFAVFSKNLEKPISTSLVPVNQVSVEFLLGTITKVLQSNKNGIPLDDPTLKFDVSVIRLPQNEAGARKKLDNINNDNMRKEPNIDLSRPSQTGEGPSKLLVNTDTIYKKKRSIITIPNDNISCARAIIVGMAVIEKNPQLRIIQNKSKAIQKRLAETLHRETMVPLGKYGLPEIRRFEKHLGVQIHIVSSESSKKVIYKGRANTKKIFLYLTKQHYDLIKSMTGLHNSKFYCDECDKAFQNVSEHKCAKPIVIKPKKIKAT